MDQEPTDPAPAGPAVSGTVIDEAADITPEALAEIDRVVNESVDAATLSVSPPVGFESIALPLYKINLGSGGKPLEGYLNVDVRPLMKVDLVADLEKRWPWKDDTVDEFRSEDFCEHLRQVWEEPNPLDMAKAEEQLAAGKTKAALYSLIDAMRRPQRHYGVAHFMNEAWRCLKPKGILHIRVPSTDGRGAWQDPTHVSYWNRNSILYVLDNNVRGAYPELILAKFEHVRTTQYVSALEGLGIVWEDIVLAKIA